MINIHKYFFVRNSDDNILCTTVQQRMSLRFQQQKILENVWNKQHCMMKEFY